MYSYLRGTYKGHAPNNFEAILVEVGGIGYEMIVPPIVEQDLSTSFQEDDQILVWVSAQTGRDQPWPVLFGFLTARQKAFWELLITVPRVGGKLAARSMVVPIESFAEAIQDGNRAFLDGLPGITLDGADKIIASLRKKAGPFIEPIGRERGAQPVGRRSEADEMREDAVALLVVMGIKRPDAQRGVDQLLSTREDITSIQDIVTEYLRGQSGRTQRPG
ncbi:MAG TPA: Holliday junction branch migration protein RuvA [Chloroflexota bacterium]|jgi:Holliday junction DNA helicase RuvA|nr:Holliday junction branch migration protein RuvA [Chloroflexota bacterium]